VLESRRGLQELAITPLEWAAGCACHMPRKRGSPWTIFLARPRCPSLAGVVQHEIAHVLVGDAFGELELRPWAAEGIACFAGPGAGLAAGLAFRTVRARRGRARAVFARLPSGARRAPARAAPDPS